MFIKSLAITLALLSAFLARPAEAQTTTKGNTLSTFYKVVWGLKDSISLGAGTYDTASAWVNLTSLNSPNPKPGTVYGIEYHAKATDSTSSVMSFLVETRYCTNPSDTTRTGSGCSQFPTLSGEHDIYGTGSMIDTLAISNKRSSYFTNTLSVLYIPLHNQVRFRIHGTVASSKTWVIAKVTLLGE